MPTIDSQVFVLGTLELRLAKLTLGQLRSDEALLAAVNQLQQLSRDRLNAGRLPTAAQLAMMITIVVAAARAQNPDVTDAAVSEALDALPYDIGFATLAQCVAVATFGTRPRVANPGGVAPGEAAGPSRSTSIDSTGSLQPPSDSDSATSTS